MKAAWYERQGPASEVLVVGEMEAPEPGEGEVRIRVAASGLNPGDVKKRQDAFEVGMPYPRVVPHSDGAGVIDRVGRGVPALREGERVWCFGAQSYRSFGTAAEFVVVPVERVIPLPDGTSFEQGACLGIPGITAHRAVHVAGPVTGRSILVQGGAGAVGQCAVGLARHAGASVIATVRSEPDRALAERAGAHHVVLTRGLSPEAVVESVRAYAPDGIHHIVEVAFAANVALDEAVLGHGGSIATYATSDPRVEMPFWPLAFKNVRIDFLGSDDFPGHVKMDAAKALNEVLSGSWPGFVIDERFALEAIAEAHEWIEERKGAGRVVLDLESDAARASNC